MKSLNFGVCFSGRFQMEVVSKFGESRILTDWFPNLITNNGLDLLGSSSAAWPESGGILGNAAVGSGSATPSPGDTILQSQITAVSNPTSAGTGNSIDQDNRYFAHTKSWTFPDGAAAGNISEVGVGPSSSSLFSRALVLDSSGSPTTITVLPDETLILTYQLRVSQPTADFLSTVDGYEIVLRSCNVNSIDSTNGWFPRPMGLSYGTLMGARANTGSIGDIESAPGGTDYNPDSRASGSYSPGSYTRTGMFLFEADNANNDLNSFSFTFGPGRFQFSVDSPVQKQSDQELTISVSATWAREGELSS